MAYKGQRYEPEDFGYPGSRHGDRHKAQPSDRPYQDDRRIQDDRGYQDDRRYNDQRRHPDDRRNPDDAGRRSQVRDAQPVAAAGAAAPAQSDPKVVEKCMDQIRHLCNARGVAGIKTMGRMFRIYDNNRSGTLSREEFADGLRDYGARFTSEETRQLYAHFDTDGTGCVNYNEFLMALRPPMSRARIDLIERAFNKLDRSGDGFITVDDLAKNYNVTHHPKFKSGDWTKKQVLEEYLNTFQVGPVKDTKVTKEEFTEYYAGVSASIDKDVYFDFMMRQAWNI